jgi:hypothetical protein
MTRIRKRLAAVTLAGLLTLGFAGSAAAQPPLVTGGLVNVTITDVIDDVIVEDVNVGVGVAANVAANVCDVPVTVAVLADQVVRQGGTTTCSNDEQTVTFSPVQR